MGWTMQLVLACVAMLGAAMVPMLHAESAHKILPHKTADGTFVQHQMDILYLFYHIHEPLLDEHQKTIAKEYDIKNNLEHYNNATAVHKFINLIEYGMLPRGLPVDLQDPSHRYQVKILFHVLYSAKTYDTFYKTAVYLRDRINEEIYVHVLSAAIIHRPDTQGIKLPPLYEILPSFFFHGEIMTAAQRLNTHKKELIQQYPWTYEWNDDIVVKWNATIRPYFSPEQSLSYFTEDPVLNTWNYYRYLLYAPWLGGDAVPLKKDKRGELFWFKMQSLLARYYLERLSVGLGEIPEIGPHVVKQGYIPDILHSNGIPYPARSSYFDLQQPYMSDMLTKIQDYERRIRDAIDSGYYVRDDGQLVNIRDPDSFDVLARLIEASVDSPNGRYYGDFISLWSTVLGNSLLPVSQTTDGLNAAKFPSVLEQPQTALRDPAFYMIIKRALNMLLAWKNHLPQYTHEQLALPSVSIQKVETDKLMTYYELVYYNITNHLHMNQFERQATTDEVSVLAQWPRLNHKEFQVRLHVRSDVAQKVDVRLFLGPKFDGYGNEIPLRDNTHNFIQLDHFIYNLPQGESVIKRHSTEFLHLSESWTPGSVLYEAAERALHGTEHLLIDLSQNIEGFPHHLLLPKGRVGGMQYQVLVYIQEHHAPNVAIGTGFDPIVSLGIGSGARVFSEDHLGFPLDRPLFPYQITDLHNLKIQDVVVYHKPTPGIDTMHLA